MLVRSGSTRLMAFVLLPVAQACQTPPATPPEGSAGVESRGEPVAVAPFEPPPAPPMDPEEASDALLQAAREGNYEEVERLLAVPGVRLNRRMKSEFTEEHLSHGYDALVFAAYRDDLEMFELLVRHDASAHTGMLIHAIARGNAFHVAEHVLDLGIVDVDDVQSALVMACAKKSEEVLNLLLQHGADIDGLGWAGGRSTARA